MQYGVLGPLEVFEADRECAPTAPRLRTVLAFLLVRANQVVSADELMNELWGERLPASPANALHVFVARLRGLLAPRLALSAHGQVLVTCPSGYRLNVGPKQLDLHRFDHLAREGELALAGGDAATAAEMLGEALGQWRGPPFADVATGSALQLHAFRIEECRMRVLERRIEADLRLGRHAELVAELETLAATHPLREGLHAQLMLALCRSGRRAEAMEAYRRLRNRLVEELAVEPAAPVQHLHQAILAEDPILDRPRSPKPGGWGDGAGKLTRVCAQLPPDVADFTGRGHAIKLVETPLMAERSEDRTAVPIVAVTGAAGTGKTALAVHCAHRLRRYYPDGQMYLDLRGTDARPLPAGHALGRLLRGLGIDGVAIPTTLEERRELFRTRTADQRLLLVLDSAGCEAQVRPLLPGGPRCGVLVTSRSRLAVLEGAAAVGLDLFTTRESLALLGRVAGPERLAGDLVAAERVVRLCGQLPLAVRVAGAKLAAKPHWWVTELAERLVDERRRLDELRVGDLDVRASLASSYHGRRELERRAFRLLALLAMPDFPAWTAAALLDVGLTVGEALVEGLADAQLVQVAGRDRLGQVRYQFHELVRIFAVERLYAEESAHEQRGALARVRCADTAGAGWLTATASHPAPRVSLDLAVECSYPDLS